VCPCCSPGITRGMAAVRIYGVDIHDNQARKIISDLNKAGTPAALAAANQIAGALARQNSAGRLTPEMRDAILATLRTPDFQGTKELYRALHRDQLARRDSEE